MQVVRMGKGNYTTVYVATSHAEAQIVQGRLENEGIPSLLSYESAGLVIGLTVDGLGQVKVQVPVEQAEDAKQILEGIARGDITFSNAE
jgi:hypothetical protein